MSEWRIKNLISQIFTLISSKTAKHTYILFSANAIKAILGFLGSVIIFRYLSKEDAGILYSLLGIMMVGEQIIDLGITQGFVKIGVNRFNESIKSSSRFFQSVFQIKICTFIILLVLGLIFSNSISLSMFKKEDLSIYVFLMCVGAVLLSFSTFVLSALRIESKFNHIALIELISVLLKFFLILGAFYYSFLSIQLCLIAFLIVPIVTIIFGVIKLDTMFFGNNIDFKSETTELFHFSKWIVVSQLAVAMVSQSDIFMLASFGSTAEVATYSGGNRIASVFHLIIHSLWLILLPKVSSYKTKEELQYYVNSVLKVIFLPAFVLLLSFPFAESIITTFLTDKYADSVTIFEIQIIAFSLDIILVPVSLVLYNLNLTRFIASLNMSQLFVNISLNYYLIPDYGASGAAFSSFVIRIIAFLIIFYVLYRQGIFRFRYR